MFWLQVPSWLRGHRSSGAPMGFTCVASLVDGILLGQRAQLKGFGWNNSDPGATSQNLNTETKASTFKSFLPISCWASCGYETKTGVFTTCVSSSSLTPSFVLLVSMQAAAVLNPLAKKRSYFLDQCCLERCYNGSLPFSWMKCSLQHWELSSKHAPCLGHKAF